MAAEDNVSGPMLKFSGTLTNSQPALSVHNIWLPNVCAPGL